MNIKETIRAFLGKTGIGTYRPFIKNVMRRPTGRPKSLLYFKTSPFVNKKIIASYRHTNYWEIFKMTEIMDHFGFQVDIVDREMENFSPINDYQLFMGLGSGNSGKNYGKYADVLPNAYKVLIGTAAEPILRNRLAEVRYNLFHKRTGVDPIQMRTSPIFTEDFFDGFTKATDLIIYYGEPGHFVHSSYLKKHSNCLNLLPAVSPKVNFSINQLCTRKNNHFLCFAGSGFIYKGVDILIEVFRERPDAHLHICGPSTDLSFFKYYKKDLERPNISYEGFIDVGGGRFNQLVQTCSYVILNSSAEACATAVVTAMRAGLVPIINYECGIKTDKFGLLIDNEKGLIKATSKSVDIAINIDKKEYKERVFETLNDAKKYSQGSFATNFESIMLKIIKNIQ